VQNGTSGTVEGRDSLTAPHHHSGKTRLYPGTQVPVVIDTDGLTNVVWADGHVKAMKRRKLTPPVVGGDATSDDLWDRVKPSPWRLQ
jgi:prepilin-type processing-associated H-X9-DG protein